MKFDFNTGGYSEFEPRSICNLGGGGGGGSTTSTVTQKADPWAGIQPQLKQAAGDTQNLYNKGLLTPKAYPDQTFANFTPLQQQAMDATAQRATNGSPVNSANQGMLTDTLNGNYLDPNSNPYLKSTYDQAAKSVQGTVNSAFGQGGRYGSGLNQQVLGNSLDNLATDIYGGNYQQERTKQLGASALAPQAANQDYTDLSALSGVGGQQQGQSQNAINDAINRFNTNNAAPAQNIQNYVGLLNGAGGQYGASTGTNTQPYYQNNTASTLGLLGSLGGVGGGLSGLFGAGTAAATGLPWLANAGIGSQLGGLLALSDMRLKKDITNIGYEKGFPIYTFRYKSDPKHILYRGVMAQDVVEIDPDAIEEIGGYMAVNYKKIDIEFARAY